MRYVWLVEGEPHAGTLQDYADDLVQAHYSDVEVSPHVWYFLNGIPVSMTPNRSRASTWDDLSTVWLRHGDDEARIQIDLRA